MIVIHRILVILVIRKRINNPILKGKHKARLRLKVRKGANRNIRDFLKFRGNTRLKRKREKKELKKCLRKLKRNSLTKDD